MGKFRTVSIGISFKLLLAFSPLSCLSQIITTCAPDSIGMTDNYDFYVFWLNNEGRISLGMASVNDTVNICPYIVHTQDKSLFRAVTGLELAHYFNYVSHGEVIKTDTLEQTEQNEYFINADYWKISPDLTNIVYKGGDGSAINKAIIIKNASTLKEGIAAEYAYLANGLGRRGIDWKPVGQYLHPLSNKHYDIIKVQIINPDKIIYFCFDITKFFGKP